MDGLRFKILYFNLCFIFMVKLTNLLLSSYLKIEILRLGFDFLPKLTEEARTF